MYKYQREYTLGWVDDVLVELMTDAQKEASGAGPMEAAVLWAETEHYQRLRKALSQAASLVKKWQSTPKKE